MIRETMLELVKKLADGPPDEETRDRLLDTLIEFCPRSNIIDLIYWNTIELTPEQVVDEALRRDAEYRRKRVEQTPSN